MLSYAALSSPAIWGKQKQTLFTTADSNRLRRQRHFKKTCGTWDLHHNVSLCLSVCLCVCLDWKGKTVIHKAGNWAGFVWRLYPATLIILGPKASTCFRRVFIVFPVPTMPCEGGGGRCRNWTEKVITWQWGKKRRTKTQFFFLWTRSDTETKCSQCHTVLKLRNCLQAFTRNYLNSLKRGI